MIRSDVKGSILKRQQSPDWEKIDVVLLDMDGTLLDKHFDDHFWEKYVPRQYAAKRGIGVDEAAEELFGFYRAEEGTLNWTDLDFWSDRLGLDIPGLKRQVDHLIAVHPHVIAFLDRIRDIGKKIYLVTNAHSKTLDLKMEKTPLASKFDGAVTSQDLGAPKEDLRSWKKLRDILDFDPHSTLLAEDTVKVLETAESFGIRYLVYVSRSSSAKPPKPCEQYFSINTFLEITPEQG